MKKSIFSKIFSGYFLIIFILSGSILVFSFRTIKDYYIDTLSNNLRNLAFALRLNIIPFLKNGEFRKMDAFVKRLGKEINTRITIIDVEGTVLADSKKDPHLMENHKNRPEIMHALKGEVGRSLRFSTTVKEEMLYVALPIYINNKTTGVLRVSLFLKDINALLRELKIKILQIVLIIIIISLSGTILFSHSLSKPIKELRDISRKIASGNFDVRIDLKNKDELKDLADSFNYMTEKIKRLFVDLTLKKEELSSIISSIQEGLMVLDKSGKVTLSNASFQKFIKENSLEGKFFWEVLAFKSSKLIKLIKKTYETRKNSIVEISIKEKDFLSSITFLPYEEGMVVVLHDITELKKLENIKKDFVVNVSHELRTPLTAIKGYVETLEEDASDINIHYLEIIKRHTERLINIVHDLLFLSELEYEKKEKLELEEVNLRQLLKDTIRIFEQKVKEKGLRLELKVKDDIIILADAFKLEQMFINLIDNAVKYTKKGKIEVSITYKENLVAIEVKDTGIGIPQEHISRIFERFYVVNKSHSREVGGTGLGLSIVKHIVSLHNGKIDIESTQGIGTRFTILLPLNPSY